MLRIPHHKGQWSWNRVIQGMFPREFVDNVMWPYIHVFRPTLVATRHVPVCCGALRVAPGALATPFSH